MNFLQSLAQQFSGKPIDWDELEEALIRADLGVPMTTRIIKTLQEREAWALLGIGDVIKAVREEIARILPLRPTPIRRANGKPTVILFVGVNGTGKTTSTAKLARLAERVAASGCIDHEQRLVRRIRIEFAERAFHLLQLGHEIRFGVLTTGRIAK